jgi:hypothetical protein
MADNVVAKLTEMLEAARAGKLEHLAYHYEVDGVSSWGFMNVSERGQLLIPARLAALAVKEEQTDG